MISPREIVSYRTLRRAVGVLGFLLSTLKPVFWLESMALWAFGLSWLTKGETIWQDLKAD